jgi:hypothetical protein
VRVRCSDFITWNGLIGSFERCGLQVCTQVSSERVKQIHVGYSSACSGDRERTEVGCIETSE